jgi:hypothetical protein
MPHESTDKTTFELPGGARLLVPDTLLGCPDALWLKTESLPAVTNIPDIKETALSFSARHLTVDMLPVLFPAKNFRPEIPARVTEKEIELHFDMLSALFFMMTCYEEHIDGETDRHGRFPLNRSTLYKNGILSRPLADEYIELLRLALNRLSPGICIPVRTGKIVPTHDVDQLCRWSRTGRTGIIRHFIAQARRGHFLQASKDLRQWRESKTERYKGDLENADPYNTFRWIMDRTEHQGLQSQFYFIPARSTPGYDPDYDLESDTRARKIMHTISARGHAVGFHPSYATMDDLARLKKEADILRHVMKQESAAGHITGGRHHYLRWNARHSWRFWNEAGLDYDSSVCHAAHAGFRAGTCHEYRTFDIRNMEMLRLTERPLILMDRTLLNPAYMGLESDSMAAFSLVRELKGRCMKVGGDFVFLWHNSQLGSPLAQSLFLEALA